ncbi:hypothetical protein RRG08_010551 [Elysia crispata]|uniref:Uncharacterized protein n=1 Tax=Elysia crispata TaxID=231223 RepID=A0AAE1AZA4_9GAST|nr:hypothetical protein RRG08_010551 [Elysia crispata]
MPCYIPRRSLKVGKAWLGRVYWTHVVTTEQISREDPPVLGRLGWVYWTHVVTTEQISREDPPKLGRLGWVEFTGPM